MGNTKSKTDQAEPTDEVPFEQAIQQLEQIVKSMESERMPLDQLVDQYEKGNQLLKTCQERIREAEQRIEWIASGKKGEETVEPFDPAAPPTSEPAGKATKKARKEASKTTSSEPRDTDEPDEPDEIQLF